MSLAAEAKAEPRGETSSSLEFEPPIPRISDGAAEVKRFFERWAADPSFRELTFADPDAAAQDCGLSINPESFRQRWDPDLPVEEHGTVAPEMAEYLEHVNAKLAFRDQIITDGRSDNPRLAAWRDRQIARGLFELGETRTGQIIHAPMAIELNVGCSVGCWFCGIDAPKMTDIFAYTPENRELWRDVLSVLYSEIGESTKWGFCYWATDPFDNPDYERFLIDFHEVIGIFPQTTTALALRDPARTRRLIELSEQRGCFSNRFSILTLRKFKEVHEAFSPRELRAVECIPQNKESAMSFANTGRARDRAKRTAERAKETFADPAGSIACVSGFLLNLIERSVKLTSPCRATDRWPLGYIVVDEARFGSAEELRAEIRRMIDSHLPETVEDLPRIAFAEGLDYQTTEEGFEIRTEFRKSQHEHPDLADYLKELGRLIEEGVSDAETIALVLSYHGLPAPTTTGMLQTMFERGLFREGPALTGS